MKDLKFYLENIAPVKRMKDGEIWNVAIWFLHAAFSSVKARPGFEEMVTELIDGSDSAEILLQFCALLLAHLNIDGWSWSESFKARVNAGFFAISPRSTLV